MATEISFDVGGTFTDFMLIDRANADVVTYKHPTTPDPSEGVLDGLTHLLDAADTSWGDIDRMTHATTLATNTVLERDGADTALLTTEGFRDVSLIGRQKRYDLYDLHMAKQDPIVPREDIYEIRERIHPRRGVINPLDTDNLDDLIETVGDGYESVAVSFLHSYLDDQHERAVETALHEAAPDLSVSRASAISNRYREYERTATASVDAYVKPQVSAYLGRIIAELDDRGYAGPVFIMKSSGGVATPEMIEEVPVQIIESGPVAGALYAARLGTDLGTPDVLSFDMGGTTAKICFVVDGDPARTDVFEVDEKEMKAGSGIPLTLPVIDMIEISAGGGSIAAATETGTISVGPESAGADPGPICYDTGGRHPTVTDADLVLGYLNPENFLGGRMHLDEPAARAGIQRDVADPLDLDVDAAAWGIKEVVDDAMMEACRIQAAERGLDPRGFAMLAFGGAGPMHAASIARALSLPTVIVPAGAGVASAHGLLTADIEFHLSQTKPMALDDDAAPSLTAVYEGLETEGRDLADRVDVDSSVELERTAEMKYAGQAHEITVDLPTGPLDSNAVEEIKARFHDTYERTYGYTDPGETVEGITWNLTARVPTDTPTVADPWTATTGDAYKGVREVAFGPGKYTECAIYNRAHLEPGDAHDGPAVIEATNSTIVVHPGDRFRVDDHGNIRITIDQ